MCSADAPEQQWDIAYPAELATAQQEGTAASRIDIDMSRYAQPGWRSLVAEDFAKVNSADDTWTWRDGVAIDPWELAHQAGTIAYEVLTSISARVARVAGSRGKKPS